MMAEIREYFGFDLGDGESAVCWAGADSDAPPMMLEICGRKSVLTALGEGEDGAVMIGEQAYLADPARLYVRFKSRYLKDPAGVGRLIEDFARCVLQSIRETGKLADPDASAFFIGAPSGWNEDTRAAYQKHFERAGFPNVTIISESRAAFMFVRESGELREPETTLAKPTLIIDAGSSTTDFTYVCELTALDVFDFGENALGGGLIDRMLLEINVERHPKRARLQEIFDICPQYEARCELEARKVKELYFSRRTGGATLSLPCESSVKIYYDKPPITCDIVCDERDMQRILNWRRPELGGESFLSAYEKSLNTARDALADQMPEVVLLTGGASRMPFMREMARAAFPKASILTGAEPEFSIARGLCYALRIDCRTARFQRDVQALIDSDKVETAVNAALPKLFDGIAPVIADELIDRLARMAFRQWKRGEIKTLGDMTGVLHELLAQSLRAGYLKQSLEPVSRRWLEQIRPELERLTDPICAACHLPLTTLRLPTAMPVDAEGLHIDMDQMVNLEFVQTVVDVVVATVVAGLLGGGGIALLMAGPVGFLVSFVIGFIASRLGTTIAMKRVDRFNMPPFMRALFSERNFAATLARRRDEMTQSVRAQLSALTEGQTAELTNNVSGAIEAQLGEMADKARILIH